MKERVMTSGSTETKASSETRERRAMCDSLSRSAKKIATLGAFLAGANGIAGCSVQGYPKTAEDWAERMPEAEKGSPSNEQMAKELDDHVGQTWDSLEIQRMRTEYLKTHEKERRMQTDLSAYEAYGFDPKLVGEYLTAKFPRGWATAANVKEVVLDQEPAPMSYLGMELTTELGWCHVNGDGSPSRIGLTHDAVSIGPAGAFDPDTLTHEFVHANAWNSSADLAPEDSLALQYRLMKMVRSEGRPKFSEPEMIQAPPGDAKKGLRDRMTEEFAVLVERSLDMNMDPSKIRSWADYQSGFERVLVTEYNASPADARENAHVVRWYLNHIDPEYLPWVAAEKAEIVKKKVYGDFFVRRTDKILNTELQDPAIAVALRSVIQTTPHGDLPLDAVRMPEDAAERESVAAVKIIWSLMIADLQTLAAKHGQDNAYFSTRSTDTMDGFTRHWNKLTPTEREELRPKLLKFLDERMASPKAL